MKITVDTGKLALAINSDIERDKFVKKFPPEKFKWGIELQTCDKWNTLQQGKIWRDFSIAANLLETSPGAIYSIVKTSKPTGHLFEKGEWIGNSIKVRGKYVTVEKGLSQFTKDDCIEAIPIICEYLEMVIESVYQEKIIIRWSSEENKSNNLPDYEFTGIPSISEK